MCVCVCVMCVCVRACVHACARARARVCVHMPQGRQPIDVGGLRRWRRRRRQSATEEQPLQKVSPRRRPAGARRTRGSWPLFPGVRRAPAQRRSPMPSMCRQRAGGRRFSFISSSSCLQATHCSDARADRRSLTAPSPHPLPRSGRPSPPPPPAPPFLPFIFFLLPSPPSRPLRSAR
jgi:hypothetical protein